MQIFKRCTQRPKAALCAALLMAVGAAAVPVSAQSWQDKVAPWVLDQGQRSTHVEVMIRLHEQADLSSLKASAPALERRQQIVDRLRETAAASQEALLEMLAAEGVAHRSYWITNAVWARLGIGQLERVATRDDVAYVHANPWVRANLPVPDRSVAGCTMGTNIEHVGAPDVWAQGHTGQGVVVAGQDTGYDWDHPALVNAYRGWDGNSADHNYNWHDAIHSGGGECGPDATEPCDDHDHGTHTMGTMVGDDGVDAQVGMAPGARWVGCRNMDQGNGTPATYTECFQWFVAPTDLNGQNPDVSRAPHVINNSWGCPASEGCTDPTILQSVVENVVDAGIVVVVSAGNSGSGCSSVSTPAAIYDASYTVGSTTLGDSVNGFSSRGPVTADSSGRLKPDISAPGSSICSSIRGGVYGTSSGTSMASPHVAGLVALIISANPALAGQVDAIEQRINETAVPLTHGQTCGGVPGSAIPNNTTGFGRIDALGAAGSPPEDIFESDFE